MTIKTRRTKIRSISCITAPVEIGSWNCMIELEAGHSNHSFYCPSQVGEGRWGKIAIQAALYNLPRPPPHHLLQWSISRKRCTKVNVSSFHILFHYINKVPQAKL